jgi:F-type H+-transporting ATPase subunit alpha
VLTSTSEGNTVKCTGRILEVPVGPELVGRVVNALGQPIDGKGPINAKMTDVIEKVAPGVIARQSVDQPCKPVSSPSTPWFPWAVVSVN